MYGGFTIQWDTNRNKAWKKKQAEDEEEKQLLLAANRELAEEFTRIDTALRQVYAILHTYYNGSE